MERRDPVAEGHRVSMLVLMSAYVVAASLALRPLLSAAATPAAGQDPPASPTPSQASATATPTARPTLAPVAATAQPTLAPAVAATAQPTLAPAVAATGAPAPVPSPEAVHVLRTFPIDGDTDVAPQAPIRIVFDQPMDPDPAAVSVAVSPTLSLEIAWQGPSELVLRGAAWQPDARYRLTLSAARGKTGGSLASRLTLSFGRGGAGAPIPILMYHHVDPLTSAASRAVREWTISPLEFMSHLDLLARLGAHVVPLADAVGYLERSEPLPGRPVVLTFDDGNRCVYENAVPILRKRGLPATFFVPPSYPESGSPTAMDWPQLKALAAAGFTLGAHGYRHVKVNALSEAQARHELGDARRVLEEQTGAQVVFFAYPYGYSSDRTIRQLLAYGYRAAVTIGPTAYQKPGRPFVLARIYMGYDEPIEALRGKLPWHD